MKNKNLKNKKQSTLSKKFHRYYPVVFDVETGGFDEKKDALLEIAATTLKLDKNGLIKIEQTIHFHITPFFGSNIEESCLKFNKIDPRNPLRMDVDESIALNFIFNKIKKNIKNNYCKTAILVAHNAYFDHKFIMEAAKRSKIQEVPLHSFITFDTATLGGLFFGETVLAKACYKAGIPFNGKEAHGALYDSKKTALLFCNIVNKIKKMKEYINI